MYHFTRQFLRWQSLAARGGTPVVRVASAARSPARSDDAVNAGYWTGVATKPGTGAAATPWAGTREFHHGLLAAANADADNARENHGQSTKFSARNRFIEE